MKGFILQFVLLFLITFFNSYLKGEVLTITQYLLVFIPWLLSIWLSHKHRPKYYQKKAKYILAPFFRGYIVQFIVSVVLFYLFSLNGNSSFYILIQSLGLYYAVEIIIYLFIIKIKSTKEYKKEEIEIKKYKQEKFNIETVNYVDLDAVSQEKLQFGKKVLLDLYDADKASKKGHYSIDDLNKEVDLLIINESVNNIKDINSFFKNCHDKVTVGGFVVVSYTNLEDIESKINSYKGVIKFFKKVKFYVFDRAFPKLPVLQKIHSLVTKGKKKVISRTEVWGRLLYHGFDVKKEIREGDKMYLIAQKDRTISENPSPSYAPLIRLNRVSMYGNLVKIYKVRSMYPYSEFLQEKVYEMNSLSSTGKFSEDFRITKLGKMYRKYWIDEFPQFLDWFRGTIKLVGIRAMSQHFFSLYSKEYQELFYKVKPGIISPIFDEETDSFETIQKIEQEYLEKYLKNPLKTDFEYFFITLKHILKGVRSK